MSEEVTITGYERKKALDYAKRTLTTAIENYLITHGLDALNEHLDHYLHQYQFFKGCLTLGVITHWNTVTEEFIDLN